MQQLPIYTLHSGLIKRHAVLRAKGRTRSQAYLLIHHIVFHQQAKRGFSLSMRRLPAVRTRRRAAILSQHRRTAAVACRHRKRRRRCGRDDAQRVHAAVERHIGAHSLVCIIRRGRERSKRQCRGGGGWAPDCVPGGWVKNIDARLARAARLLLREVMVASCGGTAALVRRVQCGSCGQ